MLPLQDDAGGETAEEDLSSFSSRDDEDDVEVIRVYEDFEDVEIVKSDFDEEEYKFKLLYKIEDLEEEEKFKALVTVKLEDGEFEILKVAKQ